MRFLEALELFSSEADVKTIERKINKCQRRVKEAVVNNF
jgi:hypothetical protein